MTSRLAILRSQLGKLRRKRARVRWASAICAPTAVALWLLVVAFLCDWSLNLPIGLRGIMLVAWTAGGLLAVRKLAWPLVTVRESEEDLALLVEKQHKIDSDLVAALQFDSPQSKTWGSTRLATAVVDYVADFSPSLNVFEGFTYGPLPRRSLALGLTLLIVAGSVIAFPKHATAFWNRFLLGSAHYPTKTEIQSIVISGQEVSVFSPRAVTRIRIPYGQPINVKVRCGGDIPLTGSANLSGMHHDFVNQVDLRPLTDASASFGGEITHAADSFRVRFQFGDATSDATEVLIVPLPLVDLAWSITPPNYAGSSQQPIHNESGSRQLSVLERSAASLKLVSPNKTLKSAQVKTGATTIDLVRSEAEAASSTVWALPSGTPFASIREGLKYEIQVIDEDGLSMDSPIVGQFRLKTDRPPRIVASAVTRQVLPTAEPRLDFVAGDDFGIAKIVAIVQISRENGRTSRHEVLARQVREADQPLTILRGQVAIPLAPYELTKGDEIKVVLEITDWRGDTVGQTSLGEPNTFHVTDLNGILAQTGEEDKKTAKQLDEILRRELGISGEKK